MSDSGNLMGDGYFEEILTQFEKDIENIDVGWSDLPDDDDVGEPTPDADGNREDLGFAIPEINFNDLSGDIVTENASIGHDSSQGEYELAVANVSSSPPQGNGRLTPSNNDSPDAAVSAAFSAGPLQPRTTSPPAPALGSASGSASMTATPRFTDSQALTGSTDVSSPATPEFDTWLAINGIFELRDRLVTLGYKSKEQLRSMSPDEMRSIHIKPAQRRKLMQAIDKVQTSWTEREKQQQLQIAQMQLKMRQLEQQMFKPEPETKPADHETETPTKLRPQQTALDQHGRTDETVVATPTHVDTAKEESKQPRSPPEKEGLRGYGGVTVSTLPVPPGLDHGQSAPKQRAPAMVVPSPSQSLAAKLKTAGPTSAKKQRRSLLSVVDVFTRQLAKREQETYAAATGGGVVTSTTDNVIATKTQRPSGPYNENVASPHKKEAVAGVTVSARDRRHMANLGVARRASVRAMQIQGMETEAGLVRGNGVPGSDWGSGRPVSPTRPHGDADTRALVSYQLRLHSYLHVKRRNAAVAIQQTFRVFSLRNPLSATFTLLLRVFAALVKDNRMVESMRMLGPLLKQILQQASQHTEEMNVIPRDHRQLSLVKGTLLSQGTTGIVAEAAVRFVQVWLLTAAAPLAAAAMDAAATLVEAGDTSPKTFAASKAVPDLTACIRLYAAGKITQANEVLYNAMLAGEQAFRQIEEARTFREDQRRRAMQILASKAVDTRKPYLHASPHKRSPALAQARQQRESSQPSQPDDVSSAGDSKDSSPPPESESESELKKAVVPKRSRTNRHRKGSQVRKSTVNMRDKKPVWMPGGRTTPAAFLTVGREAVQSYSHHNVVVVTPGKWQVETCAIAATSPKPGASKKFQKKHKKSERERKRRQHDRAVKTTRHTRADGGAISGHVLQSRARATPTGMYSQRMGKWLEKHPEPNSRPNRQKKNGGVAHPRPWGAPSGDATKPVNQRRRKHVPAARLPVSQRPKTSLAPGLPPPGYFSKLDAPFVPISDDTIRGAFDDMKQQDLQEFVPLDKTRSQKAEEAIQREIARNPQSVEAWWPTAGTKPQRKPRTSYDIHGRRIVPDSQNRSMDGEFHHNPGIAFKHALQNVSIPDDSYVSVLSGTDHNEGLAARGAEFRADESVDSSNTSPSIAAILAANKNAELARQRAGEWDIESLYDAAAHATPDDLDKLMSPLGLQHEQHAGVQAFYRQMSQQASSSGNKRVSRPKPHVAAARTRSSRMAGGKFGPAGSKKRF